jgi:tetratricopeptide (TPR) repeat protein
VTTEWRRGALLAAAVLIAYANSLFGAFQFDDYNVIVGSSPVHALDAWLANLGGGLRPLLKLTYALNWIASPAPAGFHVFNVLVHLANAGLAYALAKLFCQRCLPQRDANWIAFAAALMFALHPAHTEAVTYVSGRSSSLMAMFYLAALWTYARATQAQEGGSLRLASLGLFALALAVKESALMLPIALLVWEWVFRTPWRSVVSRQWPYWLLAALAALALMLHPGYAALMRDSFQLRSLGDSFMTQLAGATVLLGKLLWPAALNIDPELPLIGDASAVLAYVAGLALLLAIAWRSRASRPWISLGLMWAIAHLILLNTFFPRIDGVNERQLYWADWGLFLMVAVEMESWLPRPLARATLALLACALLATTIMRNEVYSSEIALWQDTVKKSPHKARAHNNLGYAYSLAGRDDEAMDAYREALRLDPDYGKAANNLMRLGEGGSGENR